MNKDGNEALGLLLEAGDISVKGYGCAWTITNGMHPSLGATIISASCIFVFREGGQWNEVQNNLNLTAGRSYRLINRVDDKCCMRYIFAVRVKVEGDPDIQALSGTIDVPQGRCGGEAESRLGPKAVLIGREDIGPLELISSGIHEPQV
ncbi:hypothetical protein [Burkholderia vietnamiensis]|uniref:hypothetical protein n=1 Tax=Burkholderia vietnamiensis TaxID=60552 RepID=UPI001BA3285A|nr:hypothetical protein [Burkholderia vietnamiensis]MBR8206789.1 hypothetical protein [Burkholderia vietnamiensis]MCA8395591.1 hypothetical protein [Burkholderia vietnamiensis]MDN8035774.1 hypothetical protein [Burkholderia vietnamiensis]HDR8962072.1 hypothetical protein [Burkholderia vietnamiensis]HDR9247814.1 hypothetical protein [Burkholderia vietnamiensis]